ncbi:hypothetical protein GBA52_016940 [Prunus armeniaca]|nr:hypothetical protein GBA52_016940 [Prunus armeniaca]
MGNCSSLKGTSGECPKSIRVLTDSGVVLQFKGPKLASEILTDFPGHGIFQQGKASLPLPEQELLVSGQYFLLPLREEDQLVCENGVIEKPEAAAAEAEPDQILLRIWQMGSSALEVLPSGGDGVWRVKLVIDTKQLEEILSEQGITEALIETMRMAATATAGLPSTPRQTKRGAWTWKPMFSNLFKLPTDHGI